MSLAGVKVGDELVVRDVNFGTTRETVSAVARKYVSTARSRYDIETGRAHDAYGHKRAYTPAQWARVDARDLLREAQRKVANAVPSNALSAGEMDVLRRDLEAIVRRLEGK